MRGSVKAQSNIQFLSLLRWFAKAASFVACLTGLVVLMGWFFNIPSLKSLFPGMPSVRFNTALSFLLLGSSLWLLQNEEMYLTRKRLGKILASIALLISLLTLAEYLFRWNLGIDQLFIRDLASPLNLFPGRMSPIAVLDTGFCSLALLMLGSRISQYFSISAFGLSLVTILSYIFDFQLLYRQPEFTYAAFFPGVIFLMLSLAIIAARPTRGMMNILTPDLPGSRAMRLMLPGMILITLFMGWLVEQGEKFGALDPSKESILLVILLILVYSPLIYLIANNINQAEARFRESEELFRTAFQYSPVGMCLTTLDGKLQNVNQSLADMLGFTKEELKGKHLNDVTYLEDMEIGKDAFKGMMSGTVPGISFEKRYVQKTGEAFWTHVSIVLLRDSSGKPLHLITQILNSTERKQAEQAYAASQKHFQALIEHAPDGIALLGHNGKLQQVTRSSESILGYALEEAKEQDSALLTHPEDLPSLLMLLNDLLQNPGKVVRTEYRFMHKDGSWRYLESTISNMLHEPSLKAVVFNYRDITERKESEDALRKSRETYQELFENNPHPMWVYDLETLVLKMVNDSAIEHYGYSKEEFLGMTIKDIRPKEDLPSLINNLENAHLPLEKSTGWKHRKKDGTLIDVEITSHSIQFEGRQARLVLANDITERKQAEETLANSERRFRALIENGLDYISLLSAEGKLLWESPSSTRMLDYTPNEFVGNDIFELVHPDDLEQTRKQFTELFKEPGSQRSSIFRIQHSDGEWRWVEAVATNLLHNPSVAAIVLNYRDITKRKQTEEELRESEERYRVLAEAAHDSIFIFNPQFELTYANAFAATSFNKTSQEMYGQKLATLFPEGVADDVKQSLQSVFTSGEATYIERKNFLPKQEIWMGTWLTPIKTNANTATSVLGISRDITERKRVEDTILQNERQMRALVTSLDDIVFEFDKHGNYLNVWAGDESLLAQPKSQILGRSIVDVLGNENGTPFADAVMRVLKSGIPESIEYPLDVIGGQHWFIARISPILDIDGTHRTASTLIRDITKRKQVEEELRVLNDQLEQRVTERTIELNQTNVELEHASRAKDEFLANMSHELRTPLNSILGLSESLLEQRRGSLTEHQQTSLQIIESSGHHLLGLINDILDLSKIEAGKLDFYPQSVSVEEVCRSSLAFIKMQAMKKSITVTYTNQSEVSEIFADARRLKQILINLLTNAVKFTSGNGHVALQVNTSLEQNLIQFSVIDDAEGIAPKDLQRTFQPFVQVDSSLNRQYEGTGLGLALAQKMTDLHGGSVQVESEVGKGSCFTINLTCNLNNTSKPEKPEPNQGSATGEQIKKMGTSSEGVTTHRPIILLAEDNMPNILAIGEYIESYGYEVIVAHDGLEAIEKAEQVKPDLILMDIQMPAMNGLEAIAHLRANARFASTPIIALTALAMPGDRERCLEVGASEYMSKPVGLKTLVKAMEMMLEQYK